jgi:hypothetical protein
VVSKLMVVLTASPARSASTVPNAPSGSKTLAAMKPENVTETGAAAAALARISNGAAAARCDRRRMVTFPVTRRAG